MSFARNLTAIRKMRGMSQTKFGERVGMSRDAISKYETGDRDIHLDRLLKFAEVLDVPAPYLIGQEPINPHQYMSDELADIYNAISTESKQQLITYAKMLKRKEQKNENSNH